MTKLTIWDTIIDMIALNSLVFSFLVAIQGIESNNGKDLSHKVITQGIHQGDSALGRFGMMPNTILMLKMDPERVKTSKEYELKVARVYALKVLQAAKGDVYKASVLWLRGPSAMPVPTDYKTIRFKKFKLIFDSL